MNTGKSQLMEVNHTSQICTWLILKNTYKMNDSIYSGSDINSGTNSLSCLKIDEDGMYLGN